MAQLAPGGGEVDAPARAATGEAGPRAALPPAPRTALPGGSSPPGWSSARPRPCSAPWSASWLAAPRPANPEMRPFTAAAVQVAPALGH